MKIVIVGLRGAQEAEVRRTHGERCSLVFVDGTRKPDAIADSARHADAVVALITFLNHSTTNGLRKVARRYFGVDGGISRVRRALDEALA